VQFDLQDELSKGDHAIGIASLFPFNAEYQKLLDFKTPLNSKTVNAIIWFCFILFCCSVPYFSISYVRNRKGCYAGLKLFLAALSLAMAYYMSVLLRDVAVFYFPAPYRSYSSLWTDIASYLPLLLLLLIAPLVYMNGTVIRNESWKGVSKWLFAVHNTAYCILIVLFFYWGFYNVFH